MKIESDTIERARFGGLPLERLIAAIWPEAYRVALSILRDRGMAEDVAQEACAAIARSLPALKDSGAFHAWSYKIVVNHALAALRGRRHTQSLDALASQEFRFDAGDAVDLYAALASLSAVQRAAVLLHYYAGLNSLEIAAATGLPPSSIRFHLMLARRALRKALAVAEGHAVRPSDEVFSDVH